jgi:hypothetical protein
VVVSPHAQPFVSDDLSTSGESIKRVRISYEPMSGISKLFGATSERAEFVNLAQVQITCVPSELTKDWSPSVPEVPWEEDPLAFRL